MSTGQISDHGITLSLEKNALPEGSLSFPGKICVDDTVDGRLVIADTGHHRILVATREGMVLHSIGGGTDHTSGFKDGDFLVARFNSPQGVACKDDKIFVADTENHSIRQVGIIIYSIFALLIPHKPVLFSIQWK